MPNERNRDEQRESRGEVEDDLDYRWEGARPPQDDEESDGYDAAARSGSGRFGRLSSEGGVFGTTGGGSYAGGFQIERTSDRFAPPERHDEPSGRPYRTGHHMEHFDQVGFEPPGEQRGGHAGKGPRGYRRSDENIVDEVCEMLTYDSEIDASMIEVEVNDGEVTLSGTVPNRRMKRAADDLVDGLRGVRDVHNRLKIERS